jgi:hypothetical protein
VQLNVSFLDRVQRSSKGAINGSVGNDFPHFQPQLLHQGYCDTTLLRNPAGLSGSKSVQKSSIQFLLHASAHICCLHRDGEGRSRKDNVH